MDAPPPVRDLDWDPERAHAFAGGIVEIWTELLASLRGGPVVPQGLGARQVREGVALDVPEEPMPADELVAHLREAVLDYSLKSAILRTSPTSRAPAPCPARPPTSSRPG